MQVNDTLTSTNILDPLFTALDTCLWNLRYWSMVRPMSFSSFSASSDLGHPEVIDSPHGNLYPGRAWCHLRIYLEYMLHHQVGQ